MACGGIKKWTSPRKMGGIPRVSTRFSLSVENEQTDAGRDGQTCLASPNSQARRQEIIHSLYSADHEQVWQSYPVDSYSEDLTCTLYLYVQQYQYVCIIIWTMNVAAVEPMHVLSVHSYHDIVSAALLSSPVISTNEDQRIQYKCPGETWKYYESGPSSRVSVFLQTGTPQKNCNSYIQIMLCIQQP